MLNRFVALASAVACAACSSDGGEEIPDQFLFGGDRPVYLDVPGDYDHATPTPLLILLHGFGANGFTQTAVFGYQDIAAEEGILFAAPDGTVDADGRQFWNATDACCDNFGSGVDDVAYLAGLIDEISAVWNVDPDRVYLAGHSNGGYMSFRMACDRAPQIAAVLSLAGATWKDAGSCAPDDEVSVLQIHGDADDTVLYGGGFDYPSATETVEQWAAFDGCAATRTTAAERHDLAEGIDGADTRVERADDCPDGLDVELWTIEGGGHIPVLTGDFRRLSWEWLAAHSKS